MEDPTPAPENPVASATAPISVKPIRAGQREFTLQLPCGHIEDGKVFKAITLRTITAGDRRMFGDEKLAQNPGKLISKLIEAKLVRVDGLTRIPQHFTQRLLGFDRDAIVYALRAETVPGRLFVDDPTCSECSAKNHIEVAPSQIDATRRDMPHADRTRVENNLCLFHVELPEYGFKGTFRHSTGALQERLATALDENNPFAAEFEILAAITVDFNGEGRIDADAYGDMDVPFIADLQAGIRQHRYGYEFNPTYNCFRCKAESRVRVDPLDFLFESKKLTLKTPTSYNE